MTPASSEEVARLTDGLTAEAVPAARAGRRPWRLVVAAAALAALASALAIVGRAGRPLMAESWDLDPMIVVEYKGVHVTFHKDSEVAKTGEGEWIIQLPDTDNCSNAVVKGLGKKMPKGAAAQFHGDPDNGGLCVFVMKGSLEHVKEELDTHELPVKPLVEGDMEWGVIPETEDHSAPDMAPVSGALDVEAQQSNPPSWGLDRIDDRKGLDKDYSPTATGRGVHVYVLDTGIRTTHSDFGGRAIPTLEVLSSRPRVCSPRDTGCAFDARSGHGTHCAGTIGGTSYGVAKEATLHAVKVLADSGSGQMAWWLMAIDWILVNGLRPAVMSMSLGGAGRFSAAETTIAKSVQGGVTVVVAAGNHGGDACNFNPAWAPSAVTVGATDINDNRAGYSGHGRCLDIFAPGSSILSTGHLSNTNVRKLSGTSMATPHVAGVAALILSAQKNLRPNEVLGLLKTRATKNVVRDARTGSPNQLLYVSTESACPEGYTFSHSGYWSNHRDKTIEGLGKAGAQKCAARCARDKNCLALNYYPTTDGRCYLYSGPLGEQKDADSAVACLQAAERCPAGYLYSHEGYWADFRDKTTVALGKEGADACAARCSRDRNCVAMNYYPFTDGRCYLYSGPIGKVTHKSLAVACLRASCPSGYAFSHRGYWANFRDKSVEAAFGQAGADACAARCNRDGKCVAMNFYPFTDKRCYLYSVPLGDQKGKQDAVACVKNVGCPRGYAYSHAGYWSNYRDKTIEAGGTAGRNACAARCNNDIKCVAFNYYPVTDHRCYLYSDPVGSVKRKLYAVACMENRIRKTRTQGGSVKVVLAQSSPNAGRTAGWSLSAFGAEAENKGFPDYRNLNSFYALVHSRDGAWNSDWVIEDGSRSGQYKIKLKATSSHVGRAAGWYLSAYEWDADTRNSDSYYAVVHKPMDGWVSEWVFEEGSAGDLYKIKLAASSSHAGRAEGWYLSAFQYPADLRNDDSYYAVVHAPASSWNSEWRFES